MQLLASEDEKQLEKHPPPSGWRHISQQSCSRQRRVGFYSHHISGPIPMGKLWELLYTRVTLSVCFLVQRTSGSQSHPLSFRGSLSEKKSFPPTASPRWAFSTTHNSNSQRNYCNLSEDSLEVVQRISGLGLPSIQALETMTFPCLWYFHNEAEHLVLFSNFSR